MRHLVLLVLLGCGSNASREPRAVPSRGAVPTQIAPTLAAPTVAPPTVAPQLPTQQAQPTQLQAAAPEKPSQEKQDEPEKKRDYGSELRIALGSPTDCLKPRAGPDSPKEIRVEFEAYFLERGSVSRGYARSPQLDPEELKCLRTRLEAVQLKGPIEEAPRAIQTAISFNLKTP